MGEQPQFFDQWEAPPQYAAPVSDDALMQRISKLIEFAARNGPSFVELIKKKQKVWTGRICESSLAALHSYRRSTRPPPPRPPLGALCACLTATVGRHSCCDNTPDSMPLPLLLQDNPEYAFLFSGAGSEFYRWALYCKLYSLQVDQPPPQQQEHQQQQQQPPAAAQDVEALPDDVDTGFSQVLAALSGSKVAKALHSPTIPYH